MPVLTAAGQLRESGRRPRRSSTTPPTWSSRPCPLSSDSQLAHPQPVGSWDTCVGIRQLCDAQFEFSMEDADRMTPSRAFVSDPPVDASVTAAYEDDLASDGYINNSTRVWCWRPDVLASFQTLRAGLTDSSNLSDREVAVMVAATAAARGGPLLLACVGCPACRALRRGDGGKSAPRRPERPV